MTERSGTGSENAAICVVRVFDQPGLAWLLGNVSFSVVFMRWPRSADLVFCDQLPNFWNEINRHFDRRGLKSKSTKLKVHLAGNLPIWIAVAQVGILLKSSVRVPQLAQFPASDVPGKGEVVPTQSRVLGMDSVGGEIVRLRNQIRRVFNVHVQLVYQDKPGPQPPRLHPPKKGQ